MKNEVMQQEVSCKRFVTRKSVSLILCALLVVCMAVPAFAETTYTPVTSADWAPVLDALELQINLASIVSVLAVLISACIGLVFMWWAIRKAARMLMGAFRKGKISL